MSLNFARVDRHVRLVLLVLGAIVSGVAIGVHANSSQADDPSALGVARTPLVYIGGKTEPLPAADFLSSPGGATVNATPATGPGDLQATTIEAATQVNVGGSTQPGAVTVKSTQPLTLWAATANNLIWSFNLSSAAIMDIDPTDPLGTQNAAVRWYRHTATTGSACLQIMVPNTSSARDSLCSQVSAPGLAYNTLNNGFSSSVGNTTGTNAVVFNAGTAMTAALPELDVGNQPNSYNTTGGQIIAASASFSGRCSRSAGANSVICEAIAADVSPSPGVLTYVLRGNRGFIATAQSFADESTTATSITNGTCVSPTCGNTAGRFTASAASSVLTFSTSYVQASTGTAVIPSCQASTEGATPVLVAVTPTAANVTFANAGLSGLIVSYHCTGF